MLSELLSAVPPDAVKIGLTLALALFIGLEREDHKLRDTGYTFGGITTFPLVGLVSYALAQVSAGGQAPWVVGFLVVSAFLLVSYRHALSMHPPAGVVTEISALGTYAIGGLVQRGDFWIATTVGVLTVLLLELKKSLDDLPRLLASNEIVTAAKFLVLAVVILPIVPNRQLTQFHINPFQTWMVVVAVSGISFGSYAVQRLLKDRGGLMVSAILGGIYSSTVTTVALARQARGEAKPNQFAGAILTASAVMYLRLTALIGVFNLELALRLAPGFGALAVAGALAGALVYRRRGGGEKTPARQSAVRNPLELRAAFLFAAVFVAVLVITALVREHLGRSGLLSLAVVMGVSDVDPFILGLTQSASSSVSEALAASAIVVATASNNASKAFYAFTFSDRDTGKRALALLLGLAALGLVPLLWI